MSFEPLSEISTMKDHTRDGWTYVVALQLFSPDGRLFGAQQSWIAGSFSTLTEAKNYAVRYEHEITPA
jgi:hypothetical protein